LTVAASVVALILTACGTGAPNTQTSATVATPTTLHLAYFPNFTHAVGLVAVARGTIQKAIGDAKLDVKAFNAGPALIEALLAGEVDIGYVGPNPAINGYVKSKGEALRIIAGASSGGALFVVRPEANINSAKDLDGKQLATPQLGGTQDVALRYYLQQNGLKTADKGGTVKVIPTQNPDILTLFKEGKIDGAWVPEPWATRLIQEASGKVLVDERTLWPNGKFVTTLVVVRTAFLKDHPDLVRKFLQAHVETVQYIQANADDAQHITNKEIERLTTAPLPDKVIKQAFSNIDLTYDPLPQTLLSVADSAYALGFLGDSKPSLDGIFDFSLLNDVLKEKYLPAIAVPASK
jgi:NitT/TauT family transport system substrate-binding protein